MDEPLFRQTMSHFASGVTVVTTAHAGRLWGLTVSSFCSLSLNPALILICIDHRVDSHDIIATAGQFAVNILSEDQEYLSRRFASHEEDKFAPHSYTISAMGLPLLDGVLAYVECAVRNILPGGDHTIFVGEAMTAQVFPGRPLLYFRSGYHCID